ncbi:hypothetical protein FSP39_020779 [Pinctada imbricata]|uniref:Uncharacterized protein n=1 Tax=Pinctada imbricata TaxID=66713 RepID=A0AA89BL47_PINIB|nr:hypothetical protein FSP39_020779 [Pinctada imbricata]
MESGDADSRRGPGLTSISPRQRPGDHVHNASMRADIPAGTYRPTMYDQLESPRREDMYERQRRIDMSPERMFNSETIIGIPYKERPLEAVPYASNIRRRQTFTQGEVPRYNEYNNVYDIRDPYDYMERQYVSLPYINPHRPYLVNQDDYEASRDYGQIVPYRSKQVEPYPRSKQVEPLPPLDTKQPKHWMIHEEDNEKTVSVQSFRGFSVIVSMICGVSVPIICGYSYDRGRNGSPERLDRGRNGSPERERYDYPREPVRDKYDERYEKPRDPILDGYANHKMADRTTQKDYGEVMTQA